MDARRAETSPVVVDVTDVDFGDAVIEESKRRPVVVDFWADWCQPCKTLTPVLEEAVQNRDVALVKVDVEANKALAREYDISGIPAVKAFKNGHVVAEFVGAKSRTAVDAFLDELTKPPVAETLEDDSEVAEALAAGDYERALQTLLDRLAAADGDQREEIRDLMVRIFLELGQEHPIASAYRRRLATSLY